MKTWGIGLLSSSFTFLLLHISQPPGDFPEAAYFFLSPILIWFYFAPAKRVVWVAVFAGGFLYHILLVGWIRHVSFPGMVLASLVLSLYNLPWYLLAYRWIPIAINSSFVTRILFITALASFWVFIEWARSLFSLGFPWCPLSVTQWERPAILQLVPFFGGWIVSFFLIFFNLCLLSYLHHLLVRRRENRQSGYFSSLCPEFYLCMAFFLVMLSPLFFRSAKKEHHEIAKIRVGVCQPYLKNKWSPENISSHKRTLIEQTKLLSSLSPDLIVWPEASTPYPVNLDRAWVEKLSKDINIPLLAGAIIREEDLSYNSVVMIDPKEGLESEWYAKRTLVPFGEYVPFPFSFVPGLSRLVGPVGNFIPGKEIYSFQAKGYNNASISIYPLICYEDIFPDLIRGMKDKSNSLLFVTTNDAWFGMSAGPYQHFASARLRAVEEGLPLVRAANTGISGVVDAYGRVIASIGLGGQGVVDVSLPAPIPPTFFARFGNLIPAVLTGIFYILAYFFSKHQKIERKNKLKINGANC